MSRLSEIRSVLELVDVGWTEYIETDDMTEIVEAVAAVRRLLARYPELRP